MQKQILSSEIIDSVLETYLPKVRVRSQLIYSLILLMVAGGLLGLPFIEVDVRLYSPGLIRTVSEKTELRSLVSGRIIRAEARENQLARAGDTLFTVDAAALDSQVALSAFDEREMSERIADLRKLKEITPGSLNDDLRLNTGYYARQFNLLRQEVGENVLIRQKIESELISDRNLFAERIISKRELDNKEYELTKLKAANASLFDRQISQWEADLSQLRRQNRQRRSEREQLNEQKRFYIVTAPINGHLQEISGKYEGNYVQIGERLGVISPDSSVLAECYVSPQDIGRLREGMKVRFRIDAFNYNEWGPVTGKVKEMAQDFVLVNDRPVFKVKCTLDKTTLSLKNGYTATLKKGMTLQAGFIVARRSLFQLLYDKAHDWMIAV